jgi:hypothetical protein
MAKRIPVAGVARARYLSPTDEPSRCWAGPFGKGAIPTPDVIKHGKIASFARVTESVEMMAQADSRFAAG